MFDNLARNIKTYILLQVYAWKIQMAYRADFILFAISSAAYIIITLFFVSVIFSVSFSVAGWSYFELLLLVATAGLGISISNYVINIGPLFTDFWEGGFDNYLTKPHDPLLLAIGEATNTAVIGDIVGYLILFVYAAVNTPFNPLSVLGFLVLFVLGISLLSMLQILLSVLSYKFTNGASWVAELIDLAENFSKYPLNLYGLIGVIFFTIVIPIGIASYYPSAIIVGKISYDTYILVAAIALAMIYLFYRISRMVLRGYTSALG